VPSSPERSLFLPRPQRWSWIAVAVSVVVHALLLLVRIGPWLPPRTPVDRHDVLFVLGSEGPRAVDMPFQNARPSGGVLKKRPPTSGITALPVPETGPVPEKPIPMDTATVVQEPEPADTFGRVGPARDRGHGRIGPAQGEGKLWVRPLPLPPQELARAVAGRSHIELVDSAVTAIVQVYIDSVLNSEPANSPLPSWTTKIGDQQVGLDSKWIYLGPIKIPTALVAAFLPLGGGSAETADMPKFHQLQQMREDVAYAARRAQTIQDFKRAIKELRAEREREREFKKNQKTPPPKPPADTTEVKP
jgi:hypothetical protein